MADTGRPILASLVSEVFQVDEFRTPYSPPPPCRKGERLLDSLTIGTWVTSCVEGLSRLFTDGLGIPERPLLGKIVTWCWDADFCGEAGLIERFVVENSGIAIFVGINSGGWGRQIGWRGWVIALET